MALSSDERVLETIFNPEHPIVGELHFVSIHKYTSSQRHKYLM